VTEPPTDSPSPGAPEDAEAPPAPKPKRHESWLLNAVVVAAFIALLAYLYVRVVRVGYIPTGSMRPTIQAGDRVLIHVGAYRHAHPKRGDVVAFWSDREKEYEVKRVIGIAGDRLFVGGGFVLRNGELLNEPYLPEPMIRERPVRGMVPDGHLFVMGDNRNESEDSRDYGPVREDRVLGRLFLRILPLSRSGRVR